MYSIVHLDLHMYNVSSFLIPIVHTHCDNNITNCIADRADKNVDSNFHTLYYSLIFILRDIIHESFFYSKIEHDEYQLNLFVIRDERCWSIYSSFVISSNISLSLCSSRNTSKARRQTNIAKIPGDGKFFYFPFYFH